MTVIGNPSQGLQDAATAMPSGKQRSSRIQALIHSLTCSLDMAARGYLCAPLVECDPLVDPECTEAGVKLRVPESPRKPVPTSVQAPVYRADVLSTEPRSQGDDA